MKLRFVAIALLLSLTFAARSEAHDFSTTEKSALIGGGIGLATGGALGYAYGRPFEGALIGGGLGALGGAGIGYGLERRDRDRRWSDVGYGDPNYYGNAYYGDPNYQYGGY